VIRRPRTLQLPCDAATTWWFVLKRHEPPFRRSRGRTAVSCAPAPLTRPAGAHARPWRERISTVRGVGATEVGLAHLIDEEAAALGDPCPPAPEVTKARPRPDPATPEGLLEARRGLSSRAPDPRALKRIARAGDRRVAVRVITPKDGQARAVYLQVHGGGFYMDSAARSDRRNAALADAVGAVAVSVDYRLAPEHPWPAAPDDCETAALWLVEEAEASFGTARLMIGGASAGATLAVATLLRLRDRGLAHRFVGAVLQFGAYDLSGRSPSGRLYADEWFIQAYAGHVEDRTLPDISPLYGDLRDLPPSLLVVGTLDRLLEDSLAMAARLSAAGNEVDVRVYPGAAHGFTSLPTDMGELAVHRIESWLTRRLEAG